MSSEDSIIGKADFAPAVVGQQTDCDHSVVSSAAHDGISQQPRPGVHQEALHVLESKRALDYISTYYATTHYMLTISYKQLAGANSIN